MATQFANRREILDVIGIGLRANGEVLRNPPEENLESVSRNADSCCWSHYTLPSSDPEAIRSSLKGFLQGFSWVRRGRCVFEFLTSRCPKRQQCGLGTMGCAQGACPVPQEG